MAKDILFDDTGDLGTANGDLVIGNSDEQHIEDIITANKGDYKQYPLTGVGIMNYLNSASSVVTKMKLEKELALQLESDGAKNITVGYKDGKLDVEGTYE